MTKEKPRIVFAGCARDCAAYLPHVLANVEAVAQSLCSAAAFVFVENDSNDDTAGVLRDWGRDRENFRLIRYPRGELARLPRTMRLAQARNRVLAELDSLPDFDRLLVLDMDGVNQNPWNLGEVKKALAFLEAEETAAAVFTNTRGLYYDLWAFRHPSRPGDVWEELADFRFQNPELDEATIRDRFFSGRIFSIPEHGPPLEVDSAFGGLGVYKIEALVQSGAAYCGHKLKTSGSKEYGWQCCEHAALHAGLRRAGWRLFIFPSLVNIEYKEVAYSLDVFSAMAFDPNLLDPEPAIPSEAIRERYGPCRLCGGELEHLFQKRLLAKHDVQYFRCRDCRSVMTEAPYWLDEAYQERNERFDCGQFLRSLDNAAILDVLASFLGRPGKIIDYGCGSGLCVRMLRDAGRDAWGCDKYGLPRLCQGFHLEKPEQCAIINLCEVAEHFADPAKEMGALFAVDPDVMVIQTVPPEEPVNPGWSYFAPEHGQHVFFWSSQALQWLAARHGKIAVRLGHFVVILDAGLFASLNVQVNTLFQQSLQNARDIFLNKLGAAGFDHAIRDSRRLFEEWLRS